MNQTSFFEMLGAPLKNFRWSWGAVCPDGTVFLRVWEHDKNKVGNSMKIGGPSLKETLGGRERIEHIEKIAQGSPCYLVMCTAREGDARLRRILSFNKEQVFRGGKLKKDKKGKDWIELLLPVPVSKVKKGRPTQRG